MQKIKRFLESEKGKDILIVIIVILVGLGSFELGRLSKGANSSSGVKIEYPSQDTTQNQEASALSPNVQKTIPSTTPTGKGFFASNRGSKYYSVGCSGGKTIKQENRVYFATSTEAEAAGYELSSLCR